MPFEVKHVMGFSNFLNNNTLLSLNDREENRKKRKKYNTIIVDIKIVSTLV